MTIEKEALVKAAEAVRRRERAAAIKQMSREEMQALIRRSPLWNTIPGGVPAAGEPITRDHLNALMRNRLVAMSLGINPEFPAVPLTEGEQREATEELAEYDRLVLKEKYDHLALRYLLWEIDANRECKEPPPQPLRYEEWHAHYREGTLDQWMSPPVEAR